MDDDSRPRTNSIERQLVNNPALRDKAHMNRKRYEGDVASLEHWASTGFKSIGFVDEQRLLIFEDQPL